MTEIEWQILQTDTQNPSANELQSSRQMGNGNESVTRRYEFYKYVGPYDVNSPDGANTGTNEALCASVGADGVHGGAGTVTVYDTNGVGQVVDCSTLAVVGDYIGAQNAAADVAMPLTANGANLVDGEVGVQYPNRPLIFGGSGGPYSIAFTGGTLPATNAGSEFNLSSITGVLNGGVPNGTGTATFSVHATDLVDPTQPAVDATFNITVVDALTVDDLPIPDGAPNATTNVNLTASGGETPFTWGAASLSAGLQASVFGNTLSVTADAAGTFNVQVTVDDSLGGTSTKTLLYHVSVASQPTPTPTETPTATPTADSPTPTAGACQLAVDDHPPAQVSTDLVYIARALLHLPPVPTSFRSLDPSIPPDATIDAHCTALIPMLDVDMDGTVEVATDIVYIARRRLGLDPVPPSFRMLSPGIPDDAVVAGKIDALCP